MTTSCSRLHEVEALRDGRLSSAERSSFQRHVGDCVACADELKALEALVAPLRESSPDTDELHMRRERARLLAAFAASAHAPVQEHAARRPRLWAAVAATAALVASALLAFWVARPAAPASSSVVHADSAARWSTRLIGEREEILLSRGALLIHVDHHAAGKPRLRVTLPDGELEDIGTIFTVSVQDDRTARVAVQEGSVVLRLRGRPAITIEAGATWTPDVMQPTPVAKSASGAETRYANGAGGAAALHAAHASGAQVGQGAERANSAAAQVVGRGSTAPAKNAALPIASPLQPRASAVPSSAAASDPALDYRDATAAFGRGQNRKAAAAFAAFVARHPRDPRAEDAAYLRVLALQKSGMSDDVVSAARQYLQRYPDGLRHAEVARLLTEGENGRATGATRAQ